MTDKELTLALKVDTVWFHGHKYSMTHCLWINSEISPLSKNPDIDLSNQEHWLSACSLRTVSRLSSLFLFLMLIGHWWLTRTLEAMWISHSSTHVIGFLLYPSLPKMLAMRRRLWEPSLTFPLSTLCTTSLGTLRPNATHWLSIHMANTWSSHQCYFPIQRICNQQCSSNLQSLWRSDCFPVVFTFNLSSTRSWKYHCLANCPCLKSMHQAWRLRARSGDCATLPQGWSLPLPSSYIICGWASIYIHWWNVQLGGYLYTIWWQRAACKKGRQDRYFVSLIPQLLCGCILSNTPWAQKVVHFFNDSLFTDSSFRTAGTDPNQPVQPNNWDAEFECKMVEGNSGSYAVTSQTSGMMI